jgi:predicted amidophosphoribosyltransferase
MFCQTCGVELGPGEYELFGNRCTDCHRDTVPMGPMSCSRCWQELTYAEKKQFGQLCGVCIFKTKGEG